MFKHFLFAAVCSVILMSDTARADSNVMHQQIDGMRRECVDQGGQFEYPKCYLPEEDHGNSSDGTGAVAAGADVIGALCLFSYLYDTGPCASGNE